jgi:hypothetical protein
LTWFAFLEDQEIDRLRLMLVGPPGTQSLSV